MLKEELKTTLVDDSKRDTNLNFLLCLKLLKVVRDRKARGALLLPLSSVKNFRLLLFHCDAGHEAFGTCLCCFIFIDFEYGVREKIK